MLRSILRHLSIGLAVAAGFGLIATGAWAQSCAGKPETNKIILMADWLPVTVSQGPFWEAKINGYYADEGLDVALVAQFLSHRPSDSQWSGPHVGDNVLGQLGLPSGPLQKRSCHRNPPY